LSDDDVDAGRKTPIKTAKLRDMSKTDTIISINNEENAYWATILMIFCAGFVGGLTLTGLFCCSIICFIKNRTNSGQSGQRCCAHSPGQSGQRCCAHSQSLPMPMKNFTSTA
jgi:hypothetical protein